MKSTFIGTTMAQTPNATKLWEYVLNRIPFSRIIEFGSYRWGMSLFFYLFCLQKNAEFYTYDISSFSPPRVVREIGLLKHFQRANIFYMEEAIGELIQKEGVTLVFCDGGNKKRELDTFSQYLKKGDFIAVHDWGTEVWTYPSSLTEVFVPECNVEGMTRIFQYA